MDLEPRGVWSGTVWFYREREKENRIFLIKAEEGEGPRCCIAALRSALCSVRFIPGSGGVLGRGGGVLILWQSSVFWEAWTLTTCSLFPAFMVMTSSGEECFYLRAAKDGADSFQIPPRAERGLSLQLRFPSSLPPPAPLSWTLPFTPPSPFYYYYYYYLMFMIILFFFFQTGKMSSFLPFVRVFPRGPFPQHQDPPPPLPPTFCTKEGIASRSAINSGCVFRGYFCTRVQ